MCVRKRDCLLSRHSGLWFAAIGVHEPPVTMDFICIFAVRIISIPCSGEVLHV
jgi:hypothetical protein